MEQIKDPSIELHPDISHLTHEQIDDMRNDYQNGEIKVKDIMAKYEISGFHPSIFYKRIPPKVDRDMACPVCNVYSIRLLQGKGHPFSTPFCPDCGQTLISEINPEKRARELRVLRKESMLVGYYDIMTEVKFLKAKLTRELFNQLTFEQKVFLGAVVASCIGEDMAILEGEELNNKKVSPTGHYHNYMVDSLVISGVLPSNDLWRTRIHVDNELAKELMFPDDKFGANLDEQLELWKTMAYHEIADYYSFTMEGISLKTAIGQKGRLTIKALIDELSVAQIFFLIYTSSKDACEFIVKAKGSRPHAANTVLYNCLKKKDRFQQNGWNIRSFFRPVNYCPQSEMSSYLFDKILRIGDKGYTERPCLDIINKATDAAIE